MDYTLTVKFQTDDHDAAVNLAVAVLAVAPYMVDNVDSVLEGGPE